MNLIFTLTMPGNNSWNGKWSGQGKLYAVIRKVSDKRATEIVGKSFGHNFGDGWYASVSVRKAESAADTRSVKKHSQGFCGYEWMINNIIYHGTASDPKKEATVPA